VIVSRAQLEAMRANKPIPPLVPQLTPDAMTVRTVQQQLLETQARDFAQGHSVLRFQQNKMRIALNKARKDGFTHQHFNQQSHVYEHNP